MTRQTEFVDVAGGRLAFDDYGGESHPVIMVPGMGALRSEYRYLAQQLCAAGFRSIALDVRGHGESSVPWDDYKVESVGSDILALADGLGFDSMHLVGTSKSAGSVVWAAAEAPERIKSVVLIGPFVHDAPTNPVMKAMMWLLMKNPWNVASWLSYYRTLYPTQKPADFEAYLDQLRLTLRERGRMNAAYQYGAASLAESDRRLHELSMATMVVMGTKDPDFRDPRTEAARTAEEIGAELRLIDGAGHYPQTEMPDQTNPVIVDFIRKCERQSSRAAATG